MYDFLADHALKNVWCAPGQDVQSRVKPARLTPALGVFNAVQILWGRYTLPLAGTRFHVYQIGQLHPALMGLFPVEQRWVTMADACGLESLIVDIYASTGVQLPRSEVWYRVTANKNLIIAVKSQPRIPINLETEDIYVRVYSNAYFNSLRADAATDVVVVKGATCLDTDAIIAMQVQYNQHVNKPGLTSAYVNGFLVDRIDLITVKPGDHAEFVYDASVKRVVDFPISRLESFNSELDSQHKYLLHYPGNAENTIDYHDDLDFFVVKPGTGGRYQGVYYHRNREDSVRQVTHKDYSLMVPYVVAYASDQGWESVPSLVIRAVIRKSGWLRPLVNEDSRIKELYKLDDESLIRAMVGVDSVVDTWTATNLESSQYTRLMRSEPNAVTGTLVENAYGYNAISSLVAATPTPVRIASNQKVVDVPYGLQQRSTGYEYNSAGHLLSWSYHLSGAVYPTREFATELVEMIAGEVSDQLDERYGELTTVLEPRASYRMYVCPMAGGIPDNQWVDVTGSGQYAIVNNRLTWLINRTQWFTCVRSDRTSLGYSLSLPAEDGVLKFSLASKQVRSGVVSTWLLQIPLGELDVWLNGRSLIEGLDYFVAFPQIVICNKEYLVNPRTQAQRVTVRFSGFCKPDFTREFADDVGFVRFGRLSHNNRFDIRDDKVMRIVVDGALYDRRELEFSEDNPALVSVDARNGSPYVIRDLVVPMRGFTDQNTYVMREHSREIDAKVAAYMSLKYPEPVSTVPNVIPPKYVVYSPFFNKVMRDLEAGYLQDARIFGHYNDIVVKEICAPYEWLLEFDPTQLDLAPDDNYVDIHPHNEPNVVTISVHHYKFMARVVKLYLNDKVEMSHFINLTPIT